MDIVGVDGFDWGGESFAQAIQPAFNSIKIHNKPIWVTSTGKFALIVISSGAEAAGDQSGNSFRALFYGEP